MIADIWRLVADAFLIALVAAIAFWCVTGALAAVRWQLPARWGAASGAVPVLGFATLALWAASTHSGTTHARYSHGSVVEPGDALERRFRVIGATLGAAPALLLVSVVFPWVTFLPTGTGSTRVEPTASVALWLPLLVVVAVWSFGAAAFARRPLGRWVVAVALSSTVMASILVSVTLLFATANSVDTRITNLVPADTRDRLPSVGSTAVAVGSGLVVALVATMFAVAWSVVATVLVVRSRRVVLGELLVAATPAAPAAAAWTPTGAEPTSAAASPWLEDL